MEKGMEDWCFEFHHRTLSLKEIAGPLHLTIAFYPPDRIIINDALLFYDGIQASITSNGLHLDNGGVIWSGVQQEGNIGFSFGTPLNPWAQIFHYVPDHQRIPWYGKRWIDAMPVIATTQSMEVQNRKEM